MAGCTLTPGRKTPSESAHRFLACSAACGLHSLLEQLHGVLHPHGVHLPQDGIQAQSI